MSEKHPFGFAVNNLSQREAHFFFVRAIFSGKRGEPVRIKVNEGIANHDCAAVRRIIQRHLPIGGAFDRNRLKHAADLRSIFNFHHRGPGFSGEYATARENRHLELLRVILGRPLVVAICHHDARNRPEFGKGDERFFGERNGINEPDAGGGDDGG